MQTILTDIATKHALHRRNGKWDGPCPKCGGGPDSNRFLIKDDGGFKCYAACGFKGDIITWLREMEQMSCPEAHLAANLSCRAGSCSARGTCRLGDGSGKKSYIPRSVVPVAKSEQKKLPSASVKYPCPEWSAWADDLVQKKSSTLLQKKDVMAWLAARGIDEAAVVRFCLGWIDHSIKVSRASIGLSPRDGKTTLWIPDGLLIPIFDGHGRIHRIRVRRPQESRAKFLPDLKYVWIEGSGTMPLVIPPVSMLRGASVQEAELDAMATAAAHDGVMVIALGTVSAGLPEFFKAELANVPVILVSLDADQGEDGKPGPGPEAIANWQREFRQAQFWPVPSGKDVGEFAGNGGDLHLWIESGLVPAAVHIEKTERNDLTFPPDSYYRGGGEEKGKVQEGFCYRQKVDLADGREFYLVDNRDDWEKITAAGHIVFSENEFERLHAVIASCSDEEKVAAANAFLDVKELFSGAYIRRGVGK